MGTRKAIDHRGIESDDRRIEGARRRLTIADAFTIIE